MAALNARRLDWRFGTQFSITFSSILRRFSFLFHQISNFDAREGWRELLTLFLLLYVYGRYDYFVNLKIVSKTTKCRDFTRFFQKCTVILPIFTVIFLQPYPSSLCSPSSENL